MRIKHGGAVPRIVAIAAAASITILTALGGLAAFAPAASAQTVGLLPPQRLSVKSALVEPRFPCPDRRPEIK